MPTKDAALLHVADELYDYHKTKQELEVWDDPHGMGSVIFYRRVEQARRIVRTIDDLLEHGPEEMVDFIRRHYFNGEPVGNEERHLKRKIERSIAAKLCWL